MSKLGRVRVYDSRISGMFDPSGEAGKSATGAMRQIERKSRELAPKRSMRLAQGMRRGGTLKVGRYHATSTVTNVEDHALWVIEGTRARITSTRGPDEFGNPARLIVPRGRGIRQASQIPKKARALKYSVRGQRANDFISRAAAIVLRSGLPRG